MDGHKLKQLQTRKKKLEAELERLDVERKESARAYDIVAGKIKAIKDEISNHLIEPVVSEHALLRYIERKMDFDLDEIKKEILTDDLKIMIKKLGNGKYPIVNGKAVVKEGVIISIV